MGIIKESHYGLIFMNHILWNLSPNDQVYYEEVYIVKYKDSCDIHLMVTGFLMEGVWPIIVNLKSVSLNFFFLSFVISSLILVDFDTTPSV